MAIIRIAPLTGPIYHTLDFKEKKTGLSDVVEPLVLRHILSGKDWPSLFSNSATLNIAQGIDFAIHNIFDPSRASRLFKKHETPDSFMAKANAKGLSLQWEDCVFVLLCLAKVGITGYDPTFSLRDSIDITDEKRYPDLATVVDLANAFAFLENEFYPIMVSAISKANTHVNDGVVTEEGKMRTYFMGTDVPAQILSEFHVAWKKVSVRAANGTLSKSYNSADHTSQLKACIAQRFLSQTEWTAKYGQWSAALADLFNYTNFTYPYMFSTKRDTLAQKDRERGVTVEELRTAVTCIPAIKEGALTEGAARVLSFVKAKHSFVTVTSGVDEVGRLAPFTRLASRSAILPSHDARPYEDNPVVAISEVTPTLYGQQFLISAAVTAGVSGMLKTAHNNIVTLYNDIKSAYVSADAPFTKRDFLDAQTAAAVADLPHIVQLDAALDAAAHVIPAEENGVVRVNAEFTGDVAATLAAVGFTNFNHDFSFEYLDDLFTASATDDRFTAVKKDPFYGIPLGDDVPFVNTVKNSLISTYGLLTVIHPDDFRTSIVLPKIKGRKSIRATQILANYGINKDSIFLKDYYFEKKAEILHSALTAIWSPTALLSEDTDDLILDAALSINKIAVPLFGDWVKNQILTQHSQEHYVFASHADQNRVETCKVMSAVRLYISLINLFSPATAKTLLWIVRTAGTRAAANYFNLYLEKGGK